MVSEPAVSETIVFTRVIFRKHRASQLKALLSEPNFYEKHLNINS